MERVQTAMATDRRGDWRWKAPDIEAELNSALPIKPPVSTSIVGAVRERSRRDRFRESAHRQSSLMRGIERLRRQASPDNETEGDFHKSMISLYLFDSATRR